MKNKIIFILLLVAVLTSGCQSSEKITNDNIIQDDYKAVRISPPISKDECSLKYEGGQGIVINGTCYETNIICNLYFQKYYDAKLGYTEDWIGDSCDVVDYNLCKCFKHSLISPKKIVNVTDETFELIEAQYNTTEITFYIKEDK